jgi:DNA-binding CsgD family transcriptional regulator
VNSDQVIELSYSANDARETFDRLLAALRDHFESDVGMLHVRDSYPLTGGGPIASLGFDGERMRKLTSRWATYNMELEPLRLHAAKHGNVVSERDVFTQSALAKKAFHRELVLPERGTESVVAYLPWRGRTTAAVMLGSRRQRFSSASRAALARLVPALALVAAATPPRRQPHSSPARLTRREQEVLAYVEAGLSNAQIARCLGTSTNTVRNQVSSILEKFELESRVQLAAHGLSQFAVSHR